MPWDAPVRAEVSSGLDRASKLVPGHAFAELIGGVHQDWGGASGAFLGLEAVWRPRDNVDVFGFAKADQLGVQAGGGVRVSL